MGSAFEVEYHILLARDLGLITAEHGSLEVHIIEIKRMLAALLVKIRADSKFKSRL